MNEIYQSGIGNRFQSESLIDLEWNMQLTLSLKLPLVGSNNPTTKTIMEKNMSIKNDLKYSISILLKRNNEGSFSTQATRRQILARFATDTGCRDQEVCGLKWE